MGLCSSAPQAPSRVTQFFLHTDTHIHILLVFRLHSHTVIVINPMCGGVVIGSRLTKKIPHTIIVLIN